ncbi:unnamed protein product, partial [marine sediment metagenome]
VGTATIVESSVDDNIAGGNGGGIYSKFAEVAVIDSLISGNSALGHGGGAALISDRGSVAVADSTISGNMAAIDGGGVFMRLRFDANAGITGSTVSDNAADGDGGGIWIQSQGGATFELAHSTITGNVADANALDVGIGGGVFSISSSADAPLVAHTIVADNRDGDGTMDDIVGEFFATSHHNLIGVDTGFTGISDGVNGNIIGTAAVPVDPMLGPLQDNGGPTLTHAPLPGSPVIDAGDPAFVPPPFTDQRGYYRVVDGDA